MPKTIRELADELNVSKQTIQYHYQRLPAKNRQKDSRGANIISPTAERIIRDKVAKPFIAKNQQTDSKKTTKTSKENNELVATLRREVEDLKSQRDKQLATKDQQISSKDRQIDHLTKLIDQQQRLQLTSYLVVIQPTITNSRCHLFAQKNLLPYNSQFYMPTS
jgi:predicted DNA binding protein